MMADASGPKRRVLHLLDHIGAGGAQQLILDIVQNADPSCFEFTVAYFFDRHHFRKEYEDAGCRVAYLGGKNYRPGNLWDPRLILRARKLLRGTEGFDVIHVHLYYSLLAGPLAARMSSYPPAKVVYTLHALRHQLPFYTFPAMRMVSPLIGTFVAEVELSRQEMLRAGIPQEKIVSIQLATRYTHLDGADVPQEGGLRSELGIDPSAPVVLNIGRLHKAKGQALLIDAAAQVVRVVPNCVFLIVGDGEEEARLRAHIRSRNLQSNVLLAGYRRDLPALYTVADVVAVSSLQEGVGVVTLDSLAWGKPVVAFDVGALGEVVRPGETGFLVRAGDVEGFAHALVCCLTQPEMGRALGSKGQDLVRQQYSLPAMVSGYERLYSQIGQSGTVQWMPA
ncbi:MAG TPA: glycosyltransferase [Anaerolineales bacterium]|nr:glycosyltransferase [Anaerolineales bacterium]